LETQEPIVLWVNHLNDATWTHIGIFEGRDLVEFVILPSRNADASPNAVSFATTRNSGFSVTERAAFARIAPALRSVCELRTLRSAEQALLDPYVGALTARRILMQSEKSSSTTMSTAMFRCLREWPQNDEAGIRRSDID
jgi:adenylate cyclase